MITTVSHFQTLPFDVVFEILCYLSAADITRLGLTCRNLNSHTASPQVWAEKYSYLYTEFPGERALAYQLSPAELRNKVVREAQVDRLWRRTSSKPRQTTKIKINLFKEVFVLDLLPGGEHLLIVLSDGAMNLLSLDNKSGHPLHENHIRSLHDPLNCSTTDTQVSVNDYFWLMSSETTGYLMLKLNHPSVLPIGEHHIHYRIYELDLHADPHSQWLPLSGEVRFSSDQYSHNWRIFGRYIYYIFHYVWNVEGPWVQLALIDTSCLTTRAVIAPSCYFRLKGAQYTSGLYICDFNVISSQRIIVTGLGNNVSIYDLPQHSTHLGSEPIDISPIWTWNDPVPASPRYFDCGTIMYNSRSDDALCWVVDRYKVFHRLLLSTKASGNPCKDHQYFESAVTPPFAMGNVRGMSGGVKEGTFIAETTTASDCVYHGSIEIPLDEGLRCLEEMTFSFEESTGRISVAVRDVDGVLYVLISDLI